MVGNSTIAMAELFGCNSIRGFHCTTLVLVLDIAKVLFTGKSDGFSSGYTCFAKTLSFHRIWFLVGNLRECGMTGHFSSLLLRILLIGDTLNVRFGIVWKNVVTKRLLFR
jgi:hypothetical protein